jgi:hypothetical protein
LGYLNFALYELGNSRSAADSFHDITNGNNAFVSGVPGYSAAPGWDLASGWGSPQTETLVKNLIQSCNQDDGTSQLSSQQW